MKETNLGNLKSLIATHNTHNGSFYSHAGLFFVPFWCNMAVWLIDVTGFSESNASQPWTILIQSDLFWFRKALVSPSLVSEAVISTIGWADCRCAEPVQPGGSRLMLILTLPEWSHLYKPSAGGAGAHRGFKGGTNLLSDTPPTTQS